MKASVLKSNKVFRLLVPGPAVVVGRLLSEDEEHYLFSALVSITTRADEDGSVLSLTTAWLGATRDTLLRREQVLGLTPATAGEVDHLREWWEKQEHTETKSAPAAPFPPSDTAFDAY